MITNGQTELPRWNVSSSAERLFLSGPLPTEAPPAVERPWFELALALERAKTGDFEHLVYIGKMLADITSYEFWNAAVVLLGHAAPAPVLREILETFRLESGSLSASVEGAVAEMLGRSMQLWAVPPLLSAYRIHCQSGRDEQAEPITYFLSDLLEPAPGPIFLREEFVDVYYERVLRAYTGIVQRQGTNRRPVWHGQVFSVSNMARDLYARLRDPATDFEELDDRLWFEASTGIDCSSFFANGEFQPLIAAGIVEEFLDSDELYRFEFGERYFFGHRIPD